MGPILPGCASPPGCGASPKVSVAARGYRFTLKAN